MYIVKFRTNDVEIDRFETLDEAEECVNNLIETDKRNDEYEPSTYIIVEA